MEIAKNKFAETKCGCKVILYNIHDYTDEYSDNAIDTKLYEKLDDYMWEKYKSYEKQGIEMITMFEKDRIVCRLWAK